MIRKITTTCLFAVTLAACGASPVGDSGGGAANTGNGTGNQSPQPAPAPAPALDYATVNADVLTPKCVRCHGGSNGTSAGVNLTTYAGVKAHLSTVRSEVVSGSMPQNDSLTQEQYNQLINWIDAGAPQTASLDAAEYDGTEEPVSN